MKRYLFLILAVWFMMTACDNGTKTSTGEQDDNLISVDAAVKTLDGITLYGTLTMPKDRKEHPVALIIAGSGPTDRNGNQPNMKSNIYKILADSLGKHGIAVVRYDKRGVGQSKVPDMDENKMRFGTYVDDAAAWIRWIKNQHHFTKIAVIGHSEGSLIGMLAIQKEPADMYISLEGAGRPIDQILIEQLQTQPEKVLKASLPIIDSLKRGYRVHDVPKYLYALFRPSVQPYLMEWMSYDPAKEIAKLTVPILIIQGTTDLQVPVVDAKILHKANPNSKLVIIDGMNHMLRKAPDNRLKNLRTYSKPDMPIMQEAVDTIANFINENAKKQ